MIGLGSMGKRRLRLIKKYNSSYQIFGVETNEARKKECKQEYEIEVFNSLEELFRHKSIDCAFICTSPLSHNEIIAQCLSKGLHVFTELNLVSDGYYENMAIAEENKLVLFLSSTLLYREEIIRMKNEVNKNGENLNYVYHIGQYLPDWHPWENYRDFFAADKRTNGCREIFAIELPWIIDVFGDISGVSVMKDKMSDLSVGYYDNYIVLVRHKNGNKGVIAADIVTRKAVRNIEIFGEHLYLTWDGTPEGLNNYDYEKKLLSRISTYSEVNRYGDYNSFIIENAYFKEVVCFFEAVKRGKTPVYSFAKDMEILKIIDDIES